MLLTLDEEARGVTVICVTFNGQHLFCGSDKGEIKMFHVPSKTLVKTFQGEVFSVYSQAQFHPAAEFSL